MAHKVGPREQGSSSIGRTGMHRRQGEIVSSDHLSDQLFESRAEFVRRYRSNPSPWPDGPGAWYRAEDWNDAGELIGDTARALDPFANARANGEPCPPLRPSRLRETEIRPRETEIQAQGRREEEIQARRGRPLKPDAEKPWIAAGVSRATWNRKHKRPGP